MKKIVLSSLIAASVMFGASLNTDSKPLKDGPLKNNLDTAKMISNNAGVHSIKTMQNDCMHESNKSPSDVIVNELVEANLVTGVEYFITPNKHISSLPALLHFNYKNVECVATGIAEPDKDKTDIRLHDAKCGNELLEVQGHFVDANKNFGSITSYNSDTQKYTVAPQSGYVLISKVDTELLHDVNDASVMNIDKQQLHKAELKTSVMLRLNSDGNKNLPVLISFESNNTSCSSIGYVDTVNDLSVIRLSTIKCGDVIKLSNVHGWFVSSNKTLSPVEEIIDKENNLKNIPLQNGYVFIE